MTVPRVILKPRRARPFFARHPWVYAGAIAEFDGNPKDGDAVEIYSHADNFIAHGLYNSQSKISVRLYSWSLDEPLTQDFWRTRLQEAIDLRQDILGLIGPGQACRLVFSEADGLSGMTVDRYDRWLVVQFTSLGMAERREEFVNLLVELAEPEGIYLRTERGIGRLEGVELQDGLLWGNVPAKPIQIEESGLNFQVQLTEGQKTGYYLDQRENRRRVAQYAVGKRVLDAFCYTGGFGLVAAEAGAAEVLGIDVSESALNLAKQNAELNSLGNVSYVQDDVFDRLTDLANQGERFGMVVLDPPKFARKRNAIDEALRGYRRLQSLGIRLLEPNGILVTCCCTGLITMDMLEDLLGQLAESEKRDVQILERLGQAPDHPVAAMCLQSNYLKCLICRVK